MNQKIEKDYLHEYEKKLIKEYQVALNALRSEIVRISEKYKDLITQATTTDRVIMSRNQELIQSINQEISNLTKKVNALQNEIQRTAYKTGNFTHTYEIDKQTGFKYTATSQWSPVMPIDAIESIITDDTFLDAIKKMESTTKSNVRSAITQGLIQGKSIPAISSMVKDALDKATNNSIRIARTESHRAIEAGALESTRMAEKAGVKVRKRWLATKDSRTRYDHREMDGQFADVEGDDGQMYFQLPDGTLTLAPGQSGVAAQDINCRCTYIDVVDDEQPSNMSARDPATGKSVVTEYKSYQDWYKDKIGI